jgi:hypothetical protein
MIFARADFVNVCRIRRCYRTPPGARYALPPTVSMDKKSEPHFLGYSPQSGFFFRRTHSYHVLDFRIEQVNRFDN